MKPYIQELINDFRLFWGIAPSTSLKGKKGKQTEQWLASKAEELYQKGRTETIKELMSKYAESHDNLCRVKGEQFKKCLRCVLEENT